jgi:hypothetical protein
MPLRESFYGYNDPYFSLNSFSPTLSLLIIKKIIMKTGKINKKEPIISEISDPTIDPLSLKLITNKLSKALISNSK